MALTILLLSLGVFALTNLVKTLVTSQLLPVAKLLLAGALCIPGAVFFAVDVSEAALIFAGTFGLSSLLHGAHKTLEAAGDYFRLMVVSRVRR